MSQHRRSLTRLLLGLALALLLSQKPIPESQAMPIPPPGSSDWPMLQADPQRTGWSPRELVPPYTHKWTWVPPNEDILPVLNQPVVGDGKVYVGSHTGVMYAIEDVEVTDPTTDNPPIAWSYQAGGGIMHTAAYDEGKVYFTSLDFNVYCLNAATGEKIWSYETGAEMVTSPLVVNGKVYVGSRDKYFYALDASSGALVWHYQTQGPIDQSAAYSQGYVIFGSDDMHVYSLDAETGTLRWKSPKLYGQMFGHFWPVIAESANLVMVRTLSFYTGESQLAGGVESILCELCPQGCQDHDQDVTCDIWPEVQQRIREFYLQDSYRRTFFALRLDTGEDILADNPPAVPYIGRHADIPSSPWVDAQGNIFVHFRSTSSFSREWSYGTHFSTDIGTLDPQTGEITTLITPARSVDTKFSSMTLDDNGIFTMGGNIIYGTHNYLGGGALDLTNNQPYCIFRNKQSSKPYCGLVVYKDRSPRQNCAEGGGCGNYGDGMSGLTISGDTIYSTRGAYGCVAAIRGTLR